MVLFFIDFLLKCSDCFYSKKYFYIFCFLGSVFYFVYIVLYCFILVFADFKIYCSLEIIIIFVSWSICEDVRLEYRVVSLWGF